MWWMFYTRIQSITSTASDGIDIPPWEQPSEYIVFVMFKSSPSGKFYRWIIYFLVSPEFGRTESTATLLSSQSQGMAMAMGSFGLLSYWQNEQNRHWGQYPYCWFNLNMSTDGSVLQLLHISIYSMLSYSPVLSSKFSSIYLKIALAYNSSQLTAWSNGLAELRFS